MLRTRTEAGELSFRHSSSLPRKGHTLPRQLVMEIYIYIFMSKSFLCLFGLFDVKYHASLDLALDLKTEVLKTEVVFIKTNGKIIIVVYLRLLSLKPDYHNSYITFCMLINI